MTSAISGMVASGVFSNRWIISNWRGDNSFCPAFCPAFCPSFCPSLWGSMILGTNYLQFKFNLHQLRLFNELRLQPVLFLPCVENERETGTEVLAVSNVETQNPLLFIISLILSRAFFCISSCKTLSVSCTMRLLHSDRADEMPSR